jgi:hypothetical protein
MANEDFHPKCQHCLPLVPESDLLPADQEELKLNLCHIAAKFDQRDRDYREQFREQAAFQEMQRKKREEKLQRKKEKEGTLFQQDKRPVRKVVRKLTVTGLTDRLIREAVNNNTAYIKGTRERIINEVLTQFPSSEETKVTALFYSRRAILKHEALTQVENEIIP